MHNIIYPVILVIAFAMCFAFYRKGLSDGIKISDNKPLNNTLPVKIKIPSANKRKLSAEQQRLQRGFQNILQYKNEGEKMNEK